MKTHIGVGFALCRLTYVSICIPILLSVDILPWKFFVGALVAPYNFNSFFMGSHNGLSGI